MDFKSILSKIWQPENLAEEESEALSFDLSDVGEEEKPSVKNTQELKEEDYSDQIRNSLG